MFITAKIASIFISLSAVHISEFYIFTVNWLPMHTGELSSTLTCLMLQINLLTKFAGGLYCTLQTKF